MTNTTLKDGQRQRGVEDLSESFPCRLLLGSPIGASLLADCFTATKSVRTGDKLALPLGVTGRNCAAQVGGRGSETGN